MNALSIICVILAALVGAIACYFWISRRSEAAISASYEKGKTEEGQVIREEYEQKMLQNQNALAEIEKQYNVLKIDAETKIAELDRQLQQFLSGDSGMIIQQKIEEINKLQKKIKKLEEEIEDYEDDVSDYEKKLKKKEAEKSELEDKLSAEERSAKKLKEDSERLKEELEERRSELALKIESLSFVQEILSAKQTDDASTKELYSHVDNLVSFITGELKDCVTKLYDLNSPDDFFGSSLLKWAITKKKSWIQGKKAIAFVGEFSAGKTSIVNRILSQDEDDPNVPLLPVSTKATTAIPTYISGGASTRYNFVTPDNVQKSISEETFKRVNKEVLDQVKGVSSLIQYFVMTYKNPNLDNLSILDTPGFNSNDKEDASRTIGVINECDALFWVFDVNAGTVNRTSIQLIKENLHKPLYVVINKVDTKAETEVDKVEQLIRKTLRDSGISVQQFIRFSSKADLNTIMDPIRNVEKDEEEDYLSFLSDSINEFEEECNQITQEANRKQLSLFESCNQLVDRYNAAIQRLVNNCQTAAEIPHYETHLFSSDKYEMSEDEYNRLVAVLNTICDNRIQELCSLYNEQMNAQREAQQAYSDYIDAKYNWQRIDDCKEQLDKLIKKLSRI